MRTVASTEPRRTLRAAALALLCGALLAGCATTPATPEEQVRVRAQQRWDALLKGDFQRAYEFMTPGGRATVPFSMYRGRIGRAIAWQSATVDTVECETLEKCTVNVIVQFMLPNRRGRGDTIESGVEETWLFEEGQWWFLYKL